MSVSAKPWPRNHHKPLISKRDRRLAWIRYDASPVEKLPYLYRT